SYRTDVPYVKQSMGIMAPRILRDVGDVPHLAALVAPRRLVISGGVTGGGDALATDAMTQRFAFAKQVYRLHAVEANLTITAAEKPADLIRRLGG
ncbi:MAG: acetylxylan esterase, partial [Planctomycetia bacterium]|nr:acetylxylan esterase [Planctomycetia bacterium]